MEKLIKRFQAHSGLASVGVSFLVLAASLIVPPLSDLQNQPTFTSNPLFWVGLVFTLLAIWTFYYALIRKPPDEIPSIKDSAKYCDTIWAMWWSGDRQYKVMRNPKYGTHFKRILLPDIKSRAFEQMMKKAGTDSNKIVPLIKRLTKLAVAYNIEVKWFGIIRTYALTFYDPEDLRAYVIKQDLGLGVKREYRKLSMFRIDEQEEAGKVQQYRAEYENVWKHTNTREPKKEDYE